MEFEPFSTAVAIAGLIVGIFCGWVLHHLLCGAQQKNLKIRLCAQTQSYAELRERFDAMLLRETQHNRKEHAARDRLLLATQYVEELQKEVAKLRAVCAPRKSQQMNPLGDIASAG